MPLQTVAGCREVLCYAVGEYQNDKKRMQLLLQNTFNAFSFFLSLDCVHHHVLEKRCGIFVAYNLRILQESFETEPDACSEQCSAPNTVWIKASHFHAA